MHTPILLLAYNRIDTLAQVWEVLRQVRPKYLFLSADGPKPTPEDKERTEAVRTFLKKNIDWPCEAYFNFLPENLGCKKGVVAGISWFFSQVEAGIILEDDTLPHPTFFAYAAQLLAHYAQDTRIGTITGTQLLPGWKGFAGAWDVIRFPLIWGWATWRRVWAKYDPDMTDWPHQQAHGLLQRLTGIEAFLPSLQNLFQKGYEGTIDTWDYQLSYLLLKENQLTIVPAKNLVQNLGHGHPLAVHTRKKSWMSSLSLEAWADGPGPPFLQPNVAYERALFAHVWSPPFWRKAWNRLRSLYLTHV